MTVVCAICSWWIIPDWPETAKFLSDEERVLLVARLAADVADAKLNRLDKRAARRIFTDWKMYAGVLIYMGVVNTGYVRLFSASARVLCHTGQKQNWWKIAASPLDLFAPSTIHTPGLPLALIRTD